MNKFQKFIKGFSRLISKPYLINTILEDNSYMKEIFLKKYPERKNIREISFKHFLGTETKISVSPFAFLGGASLPTDLALLNLICKKHNVEDYLEIGTWRGESVANVSNYAKDCYTLNLSDETMLEMGLNEKYVKMHRFYSEGVGNITHLFGDSQGFDYKSLNKKFDLVFIDGDHHAKAIEKDSKNIFSFLKNKDSIIVWHDAKIDPETLRFEVLMGIFNGMPQETHKYIYLVSNTLCAIYYPFEVETSVFEANKQINQYFDINLEIKSKK